MTSDNHETNRPEWATPGWIPKHVLAPLDGSHESERALRLAAPMLHRLEADVTLLTVLDGPSPEELSEGLEHGADPSMLAQREELREDAEMARKGALTNLEGVARALPLSREVIRTEVGFGSPAEVIADVAAEKRVDLIVMASRRESTLARGVLGSVTARVLHEAALPVLVVRVERDGQASGVDEWPQNIVTPLDVMPLSELAVEPSIGLARAVGAKLRFLRVTPNVYYPGMGGAIEYAGSAIFFGRELRSEAFEYLAPFVDRARSEGAEAYADARSGNAAAKIVDALHELPGSMAVMTTHARTGAQRLVLGSVSDKVVRASARPVLLLPAPHE